MLARISGQLDAVLQDRAQLAVGPTLLDVFVPGSDLDTLHGRIGEPVTFHTLLVLEGVGQGTSMVPRLIGFGSAVDRAFFELFTTVKNIGHRKALRALQAPVRDVAAAIARRDAAFLVTLPEIGKRTAETIIAELSGKVDSWLEGAPDVAGIPAVGSVAADAVSMLITLGERPDAARQLVERALAQSPDVDSPEALLAQVMATR
ncbi:MAG: ATP-dependent DNA helicase RuvA [Planctomycetes bacterium]|jgi:Holliday junction DNA helicase RuvA|nr:ATP-dependent DNA helicase RuvA [Planctomycetota bacterium]MCP4837865.1 ATP-dependent DNA helicase RuvA [Planctomycetota bacterium]